MVPSSSIIPLAKQMVMVQDSIFGKKKSSKDKKVKKEKHEANAEESDKLVIDRDRVSNMMQFNLTGLPQNWNRHTGKVSTEG